MIEIKCSTIFDITKTNISNRRQHLSEISDVNLTKMRSQQSNFETILQIVSLRSQPENISNPVKKIISLTSDWGSSYNSKNIVIWTFKFTVITESVFCGEKHSLEKLYNDCEHVPMIVGLEEQYSLINQLRIDDVYRNINFEINHA